MPGHRRRRTAAIAFSVSVVASAAIMISAITPWPAALSLVGLVLVAAGVAVLIWELLHSP